KLHEETLRGTLATLRQHFSQKEPKGEIVVVVEGRRRNYELGITN
ncbi:MAG: 16S rRNA (cytidine(1402)-2'-O)-methyltransferase, partial [Prevotellaceae bacterium]|nr:16S rRNA (cytidine(1402)-2'-O)-methyltransferase [Prevotellaceae bacterium]